MSELHGNIGPTRNYENLTNLPSINDVKVVGNLTPSDLGLADDASVEEIRSALENKVDKVTGKGLSENDYTDGEKAKLEGIEAGAEKNVQSDWDASSGSDAYIKNKPSVLETVTIRGTATTKSGTNTDLDVYKTAEVDSAIDTLDNKIDTNVADLDERKAEIDGYYETFTSGQTNQLIATEAVTDTEPYNYRKTGGANDVGDRVYDTLVGGSVVWNQLAPLDASEYVGTTSNVSFTMTDGVFTFKSLTDSSVYKNRRYECLTPGHKYFVTAKIYNPSAKTGSIGFRINDGMVNNTAVISIPSEMTGYETFSAIGVPGENQTCIAIASQASLPADAYFNVKDFMVIDLTAALGSTIADYVYSLETATAGAGVAWFKKYFPGIYYGYCEPHFEHVHTSAKETVGFNLWDEEWELGTLNSNGEKRSSTTSIVTKNMIRILPGTTYCFNSPTGTGRTCYYDGGGNHINADVAFSRNSTFVTPSNARYMMFVLTAAYGTTYSHDICINLHGDRDGEYEAYRKRTYPLDSSLTLRGIPMLDSANRMYYYGDIYRHDGSGERKWTEVVYDGSSDEGWTLNGNIEDLNIFQITVNDIIQVNNDNTDNTNVKADSLTTVSAYNATHTGRQPKTIAVVSNKRVFISLTASDVTSLADFKTWLSNNPVTVIYRLNTPEPFTAEPYQSPMVVDPLGTEEFVDYGVEEGTRDVSIVVGHSSEYPADLRGKLQRLPSPTGTNGDYIVTEVDGKLYLKPYVPAVGLTAPTPTEGEGE